MKLPTFFSLRFTTQLASMQFTAEVECADVEAAKVAFTGAHSHESEIELSAALIGLDLAKPGNRGCYLMDTESEKIFVQVLNSLKLGAEHFYNERLGSYDPLNNRVTPSDLGILFPDGSMRIVWKVEHAKADFDACLDIVKGAAELLLEAQDIPYLQVTDEELDDNDYDSVTNRRIELLFAAGLWPTSEDEFEPVAASGVVELLGSYRNRTVSSETSPA